MKYFLAIIFVTSFAFAATAEAAPRDTISGAATVTDGDSIRINGVAIRLNGIDAFEAHQMCGQFECGVAATSHLVQLVGNGAIVTCTEKTVDRYGRIVAICTVNNVEINKEQVRSGNAVAYRKYSLDYVEDEDFAKANHLGAWQYEFQMPDEYRRSIRPVVEALVPPNGCAIKGNINSKGDKIYHLPGTNNYAETNPEMMFCSVEEAVAAGFRAPRN